MIPSWEARISDILRGTASPNGVAAQPAGPQLMSPVHRRQSPNPPAHLPTGTVLRSFDDAGDASQLAESARAQGRTSTASPIRSVSPSHYNASLDFLRASTARNLRMSDPGATRATGLNNRPDPPRITPASGLYVVGSSATDIGLQGSPLGAAGLGRPPTPPRTYGDAASPLGALDAGSQAAALFRRNGELADELRLVRGQLDHRQAECASLQREVVAVRGELAAQANIAVERIREAEQMFAQEREALLAQLRGQTEQVQILTAAIQQLVQAKQTQHQWPQPQAVSATSATNFQSPRPISRSPSGHGLGL